MATLTGPTLPTSVASNESWPWFISGGVVLIALGALTFYNLTTARTVSVHAVGIAMLIGAGVQGGAAFFARSWGRFALLLTSAILFGVAGSIAIADAKLAGETLGLLLAFALAFSGIMRIWWSVALRPLRGWAFIAASGIFSVAAALVFTDGWPEHNTGFLGMVLAIDLTVQGAMAVALGIAARRDAS